MNCFDSPHTVKNGLFDVKAKMWNATHWSEGVRIAFWKVKRTEQWYSKGKDYFWGGRPNANLKGQTFGK